MDPAWGVHGVLIPPLSCEPPSEAGHGCLRDRSKSHHHPNPTRERGQRARGSQRRSSGALPSLARRVRVGQSKDELWSIGWDGPSVGKARGDGLQTFLDFLDAWPGHLLEDLPVFQEDEAGPKLHAEGAAERSAFAVLDIEVLHVRKILE